MNHRPGRKYVFFSHFNRVNMQRNDPRVWSVHFRGTCYMAAEVIYRVPMKTSYKPNGQQPRATLRGMARSVYSDGNTVIVQ